MEWVRAAGQGAARDDTGRRVFVRAGTARWNKTHSRHLNSPLEKLCGLHPIRAPTRCLQPASCFAFRAFQFAIPSSHSNLDIQAEPNPGQSACAAATFRPTQAAPSSFRRPSFAFAFRQSSQLSCRRAVLLVSHRGAIFGLQAATSWSSAKMAWPNVSDRASILSDKRRPCSPANERRSDPFSERARGLPCAQTKIHNEGGRRNSILLRRALARMRRPSKTSDIVGWIAVEVFKVLMIR